MPRRRRRPVARTAVVAGGAAYAGKKSGEASAQKAAQEAEQEARLQELEAQQAAAAQPAQAPAGASTDDKIEQLKKLGELHEAGVLTDEEFAAEKAKLLG